MKCKFDRRKNWNGSCNNRFSIDSFSASKERKLFDGMLDCVDERSKLNKVIVVLNK